MRIVLLTLLACSGLFADEASKIAKIQEFLVLIKANAIEQQVYAELGQQIENVTQEIAQRAGISKPLQGSATMDIKNKMTAAMKQYMSWDSMKPAMIKAYDDSYSESDIDALIAFFKSPVGQTYLAKSPVIAAKSKEMAEGQMKLMSAAIQGMTKDWLDQHQPPAAK